MLLLLACAYEPPLDPDAPQPGNVLAGDIVFAGSGSPGPTFVLQFDAQAPPPPAGTGEPYDFAGVSADEFTGTVTEGDAEGIGGGVQAAPWQVTGVADGDWLLTALMDTDANFHPLLSSHAGATCGDWVGAHVTDLVSFDPSPVHVEGGVLLDEVTIFVGQQMPTERPAFTLPVTVIDQAKPTFQFFTLSAVGVASSVLELTGPFDGTDLCDTTFWVYAPDTDGDGAPQPHPDPEYAAAGALDVWPKVYLQYYGPDAASPGGGLEPGESWAGEAIVNPLLFQTGDVPVNVPTPMNDLTLVWVPAALHTLPDGTEEVVDAPGLPAGLWSITVISHTGQTWSVPNELADFPAADASFDPASQATALVVQ